ncbi:MAG: hypothetical protein QOG68_1009, partial [Solirubrobacteraceae bacterium]|nr:hypothetical protein [Solirubrobacteraceae bacterium]
MTRSVTRTVVIAALSVLAVPTVALARPIAWGGSGSNDLGPGSLLLSVANARVKVTNVQVVMACTDTQDGTESDRAFYAKSPNRATLDHNRFSMHWTAASGGREGALRLSGTLGSNGRGSA